MRFPGGRVAKRIALEVVGWGLVLAGIAALVLPGPGLLMLFAGLVVLSQQYEWAERRLEPVERMAKRTAAEGVETWPRILLSTAGGLAILGFGVLWIVAPVAPGWWPLRESWWLVGGPATGVTLVLSGFIALGLLYYSFPDVSPVSDPWLLVVLIAGVIALTPVADRIRVPQPVLLTIFGAIAGVLPFAAPLDINPDHILPVVLPPLLFAATQRTTITEFREQAGPVLALAVGLTVSTAAVVAVVAHGLGLAWSTAWVLGAIVSPPDPVAATAVARRLRLPHRLVTILEGEGMFNDATALVMYKVALVALLTGGFSVADTVVEFALAVVVGIGLGLLLGWLTTWLLAQIEEAYTETTITIVVPFVAYLAAEELRGSGVLAVLVLGLYLRNAAHEATTSRGWLIGRSVWSYADFLITSLAFAVLGYELAAVIATIEVTSHIVGVGTAVLVTVVVFRILWIFPVSWLGRDQHGRWSELMPIDWRETTVVAWSGMRGVVTVATALALPRALDDGSGFADRDLVVVTALACVLVTLVVQGLTLAPLTSWLHVAAASDEAREVAQLRVRAARAALEFVRDRSVESREEVRRAAVLQYEGYLESQQAMEVARRLEPDEDADPSEELADLLGRATGIERAQVLDERRRGVVSAASADEVLRDIESRALRDLG